MREAARKPVGEATCLPGWISSASDSVDIDVDELVSERWSRHFERKPTPTERKAEEEAEAAIAALRERGAFERLDLWERFQFEWHVKERIRSKHAPQIAREAEGVREPSPLPKSNPSLVTEKDTLNFALDVLHRRGVLDAIDFADYARGPLEEEDARLLASKARKNARICG